MQVLYEDNHLIAVNKPCSVLVHGDKTGDVTLVDQVKLFLKEKYKKPGNVFLGVTHRLDRPTSGVVLFAKTSKALSRINAMFRKHKGMEKVYLAVVDKEPAVKKAELTNFLTRNRRENKSYITDAHTAGSKKAILSYEQLIKKNGSSLLKIKLHTGRHHQIRVQLANIGLQIIGDIKYGYSDSNDDRGIALHAYKLKLVHPVKHEEIIIEAPVPDKRIWNEFI